MTISRTFLFAALMVLLSGCELLNISPRKTVSKSDVSSLRAGAPSAEVLISFFSVTLKDEVDGKPAPHGGYEHYWRSRMQYIAQNESKEYYERVFRDFNKSRAQVGLNTITIPPYESFHADRRTKRRSERQAKG
jgi:hypothetical protein